MSLHPEPDPFYDWLQCNTWIEHGMYRACYVAALSREVLNGAVTVVDVYKWTERDWCNDAHDGLVLCVADIVSTVNVDIGRQIIVFDRKPEVRVKWCTRIMTGSVCTRGCL